MTPMKAKTALMLYKITASCLYPFMPIYLSFRAAHGKEDITRKKERMAICNKKRQAGPLIWFHAASVGETLAIFPIIDYILSQNIHVLLTTGTVTSANLVEKHYGDKIIHQYAPLDFPSVIHRFLNHWKPDIAIVCESEIWPSRIMGLAKRHIPQIMVNAHLSKRSFQAWQKRQALSHYLFSHIDAAIAQTEKDGENLKTLGVKTVTVAGNIKADNAPVVDMNAYNLYKKSITKRRVFAAISTHEGEEKIIAEVHCALKKHIPNLLTLIIPRHPERCDDVAKVLERKNLTYIRRSTREIITDKTDILLGDSIGEMGLYLKMSKVAFIGKSLTEDGGHNPIEPALLKVAIITGPKTTNFQASFDMFTMNNAARIVQDITQLAVQVNTLLTHDTLRETMVENAYNTATNMSGALNHTIKVLTPFIHPLMMQAKLNHG